MVAIRERPDTLVMRLEDALVIQESCAGEIVNAAINAVDGDPAQVEKIVQTAINVVPHRSKTILYAATHFTPRAPVALLALDNRPDEEVRRPVLPEGWNLQPSEEIRRAHIPAVAAAEPVPEVRRALRVTTLLPREEVRRAEMPQMAQSQMIDDGPPPFTLSRRVVRNESRR